MELSVALEGTEARFAVSGDIDETGAAHLKARFKELDLERIKKVILDFGGVTHIGSAGIGKLLLFYKTVALHNGAIHLVNTPPPVKDLFRELNLHTLFTIS